MSLVRLLSVCLVLTCSACGGGGSAGNNEDDPFQPPADREKAVLFSPATWQDQLFVSDVAEVKIQVFPQRNFEGYVHARLTDSIGVIDTESLVIEEREDGSYLATFRTVPMQGPGTVDGWFKLQLCRDDACSVEHRGSPDYLPYTIEVVSHTHLSPLSRIDAVPEWGMFQGNASHTGYVPSQFNPTRFTPRWLRQPPQLPDRQVKFSSSASEGGLVFAVADSFFAQAYLIALREADGEPAWEADLGSLHDVHPPSVSNGKVYLASSGHEDTFMWSFDAGTGVKRFQTPFASQWEEYLSPTIVDDEVYTNGGYYGGAYAFSAADGATRWFTSLPQYDGWTPAVDAENLYAYVGGALFVMQRTDGNILVTINDPYSEWAGYNMGGAPILSSPGHVLVANGMHYLNHLVKFDLAARNVSWAISGSFRAQPAVAKGVIYATNEAIKPHSLEARSEETGELLWSVPLTIDESVGFTGNVIASDNLVFFSSVDRVYAIDLSSRRSVWTYPHGGSLSLSSRGVLYISRTDGKLAAINLQ